MKITISDDKLRYIIRSNIRKAIDEIWDKLRKEKPTKINEEEYFDKEVIVKIIKDAANNALNKHIYI